MAQPSQIVKVPSWLQPFIKAKQDQNCFDRLPRTVVINAISFLNETDILRASGACRDIAQVSASDDLWTLLSRRAFGSPLPSLNKWQAVRLFTDGFLFGEQWARTKDDKLQRSVEVTNPFQRFSAIRSALLPPNLDLVQAISCCFDHPSDFRNVSFQTMESIVKTLLARQKPKAEELLAAVAICNKKAGEEEKHQKQRRDFGLKLFDLFLKENARPDTKVLNKALEVHCPMRVVQILLQIGVKPDEQTLDSALKNAPECVPLLLERGSPLSAQSLENALTAWGKTEISEEALQEISRLHLQLKGAAVSPEALKAALSAGISFPMFKHLFSIACGGLETEEERLSLCRDLLKLALSIPAKKQDHLDVVSLLLEAIPLCTHADLNDAFKAGQPVSIIKQLLSKGARPSLHSFQRALRGNSSEEVIDFLIEKRFPLHFNDHHEGSSLSHERYMLVGGGLLERSFLDGIPLPIIRKILPLIKKASTEDAVDAIIIGLPLDMQRSIFSLYPQPFSSRLLQAALKKGMRETVEMLVKEFNMKMEIDTSLFWDNSFDHALKFSGNSEWINFVIGLGAKPGKDRHSTYNLAIKVGASDEVLEYLESQGLCPSPDSLKKAIQENVSLRVLERLVEKKARPLTADEWKNSASFWQFFRNFEAFKLVYSYCKSEEGSFPEDLFEIALQKGAPWPVLEFILSENFPCDLKLSWDGLVGEEQEAIFSKLAQLGHQLDTVPGRTITFKLELVRNCIKETADRHLQRGAIPGKNFFDKFFTLENVPQDLFETMIKLFLQMRHFREAPKALTYHKGVDIHVPVFPKPIPEKAEEKSSWIF